MLGEYPVDGGKVRLTREHGDYDMSENERAFLAASMARHHERGFTSRRWEVFGDTIVLGEWIDT